MRACGAASIYSCTSTPFPKIPTVDSVKKWQMSFFYVKSDNPAFDWINLPEYNPDPPAARLNWGANHKSADPDAEVNMLWDFLPECVNEGGLCAADLLCCYASHRVLPLQARVHKIFHMKLPDNWDWGMEPYSRRELPPVLFARQAVEDGDLEHKQWTPDHVDPADQAGDDESPEAAEQAAQGQHDPPPSPQQRGEEQEQAPSASVPIRAVPLSMRPPATSVTSSSAPKGRKRGSERTTAQLEAKLKKQRRAGPKRVPKAAGSAIKFSKGGGSRPTPSVVSPLQRQRRERTPQPAPRSRMPAVIVPPVVTPPAAGAGSSAAPSADAPDSGSRSEPARRAGQPSIDDLFPRSAPPIGPAAGAGRGAPGATGAGGPAPTAAGAGGPTPDVVVLDASSDEVPPAPGSANPTGPTASTAPPSASEPAREEPAGQEPARSADADARALVTAKGPAQAPQGLHILPAASLLNVVSTSDSSFGLAGTMEEDWCQADIYEVTSREGRQGVAPKEMFFSGLHASVKAQAAEVEARLAWLETADKAHFCLLFYAVTDRRTALHNRLVASYHKAKKEGADFARELEVAKAVAARVPQLEADLRAARAQCAESEKAVQAAAIKARENEGELARLRRLEANYLVELEAAKRVGREEVEGLKKRLEEVDQQHLKLRDEVASKSNELSATAKRWVSEISALDRGLAAAFLEAQEAALAAASKAREARRLATGEESSEHFSMDDHLASMAARVEPITMLGYELRKVAEELYQLLWPTETLPGELSKLIKWLETAPDRFLDWKDSAARAGADMALSFVLSCSETKTFRLARACAIADFVNKGIFIEDPNPPSESEDEDMEDVPDAPEADPAAGSADAPPAGPPSAGA
ncbi:hypothetical protein QYE76_026377 [Lolium multiflorum]|uniref:Uncharacterized protein n=1 Tax=Lolium multiflorum TaxID=4521 RepID=A0AAD8RHE8_LOLMU|nr:hypothetical protein QYE76_026377 [Lolium multiflorum]